MNCKLFGLIPFLTPFLFVPFSPRTTAAPAAHVRIVDAPLIRFPGGWPREPYRSLDWVKKIGPLTDCNSPVHWDGETLFVFNSWEHPSRSSGPSLTQLGESSPVKVDTDGSFNGGRWLEATWKDTKRGKLYGWYHNEPDHVQGRGELGKRYPSICQIGAMVSEDNGATWHDFGLIITPPTNSLTTANQTKNHYYVGGVGDFGACADKDDRFLYFFAASFHKKREYQGLTIYRLDLDYRDRPVGNIQGWRNGQWSEPGLEGELNPIWPTTSDWHGEKPDGFWGPVIHWNTHLQQYVMFLNRVQDGQWTAEGYYVSFNPDIANPHGWSTPVKILDGEAGRHADPDKPGRGWYVTVIGTGKGETGNRIGEEARLFVAGRSRWGIIFEKSANPKAAGTPP